jgi:UDP-N-acetylglucosamine 2-epimerase (non-hydrolysing)
MKIVTVLGTRPEIIRLALVIARLDTVCEHVLVHTGQNFERNLSDVFFEEMKLRRPDHTLEVGRKSVGAQLAEVFTKIEKVLVSERPERVLILGDTDSGLSGIIAKRLGIPVYHMEAGNRCFDDRVPEEINRRIIDHSSDVLMPYTERSRQNLLREGISSERIYVTGNPIGEVIRHFEPRISESEILGRLGIEGGRYFLVTMHRAENVDVGPRLSVLVRALELLDREFNLPVIVSLHPRTRAKLDEHRIRIGGRDIRLCAPFGFFDFIALERNAFCVLTDSGTVQEECCLFRVPNVTMRDVTERPETLECGSNILSGVDPERVLGCVRSIVKQEALWTPPADYLRPAVSDAVVRILTGHRQE